MLNPPINRSVGLAAVRSRTGRAQALVRDALELAVADDDGRMTVLYLQPTDARRLAAALEAQAERAEMGIPA